MEYLSLILLHMAFGIFWAGAVIGLGFFILPAILDAGPAGGAVMAGVTRRRLPTVLMISAIVVVLTGVRLYMLRFTPEWATSPEGLVLALGALLGLGAFGIGLFVQKPSVQKLGALAAAIGASGRPPTAEQSAEMQALRERVRTAATLTAWHLVGATLLMSAHRLAAAL
jgi:hypothetical protein